MVSTMNNKFYGFVYVTTNNINNKKYVGICALHRPNHRTYLGSGKYLKKAIKKYGSSNFSREIVKYCLTQEDLIQAEIDMIKGNNCVKDSNWYNVSTGGKASLGFTGKKHKPETIAKMKANYKRPMTEETIARFQENGKIRSKNLTNFRKNNPQICCKPFYLDGTKYLSTVECSKILNISVSSVSKYVKSPNTVKPIVIDNIRYISIAQAINRLQITKSEIFKMIEANTAYYSNDLGTTGYLYLVESVAN